MTSGKVCEPMADQEKLPRPIAEAERRGCLETIQRERVATVSEEKDE